jgi:hypothetical protein
LVSFPGEHKPLFYQETKRWLAEVSSGTYYLSGRSRDEECHMENQNQSFLSLEYGGKKREKTFISLPGN